MVGVYFSGTGNTKYCTEIFLKELDGEISSRPMEDKQCISLIKENEEILFAYSVQFSNTPKFVRDFIIDNSHLWKGKNIFILATMGLFSGDGTGVSARLFKKYGANIIGGLHLKMPDSIGDEKILKKTIKANREIVKQAEMKIKKSVECFKNGNPTKDGLSGLHHLLGLFGQRLYFYNKTKNYSEKLKINIDKCCGCGKCVKLCPMNNIQLENKKAISKNKCTMCYRCINNCPNKALTLLGKEVVEQCVIEKYIIS